MKINKMVVCALLFVVCACNKSELKYEDNPVYHENEFGLCGDYELSCFRPETTLIDSLLNLLKVYSPSGDSIVNIYLNGCFRKNWYSSNSSKIDAIRYYASLDNVEPEGSAFRAELFSLSNMNTVVHECYHGVSTGLQTGDEMTCGEYYPFINEETIRVRFTGVFPTTDMLDVIPDKFKNSIYYTNYISNQPSDIYSLLNEFTAYYFGIKTGWELWFLSKDRFLQSHDQKEIELFVTAFEQRRHAYIEFKYFQLAYLAVAKKRYPNIHKAIMENENYWKVFNFVDAKFEMLIEDYFQFLKKDSLFNGYFIEDDKYGESYVGAIAQLDWR